MTRTLACFVVVTSVFAFTIATTAIITNAQAHLAIVSKLHPKVLAIESSQQVVVILEFVLKLPSVADGLTAQLVFASPEAVRMAFRQSLCFDWLLN